VFLSKIWLFIVAAFATVAITVALLLPRPAQRARVDEERQRLVVACDVVGIQMRDSARVQVDVAGAFARQGAVVSALEKASGTDAISETDARAARDIAADTIAEVQGTRPDFAILIDNKGRVVARAGLDEAEFGDTIAGRWLVDDALAGFLRDDLWHADNRLWRVAASPVIKGPTYVGAVVVGNAITKEYAEGLMRPLGAKIAFYADGQNVAASSTILMDKVVDVHGKLVASGADPAADCEAKPFMGRTGKDEFTAVIARLPGEAETRGAFFTVFIERSKTLGLGATLDAVRKDDMSFANFPWPLVAIGFLAALGVGLGLMIIEADRPVRKLAADSVALAKAQIERLPEEQHRGRFGSIARSINIQIDKLAREARAARRDLDQLLGPSEGSDAGIGTLDLGGPVPARPEVSRPPPPAEFRFSEPLPGPELDLSSSQPARVTAPALPSGGSGSMSAPPSRPTPPPRPKPPVPGMGPAALAHAASGPASTGPSPSQSNPQISPALVMAAPGGLSGLHELLTSEEPVPAVGSPEEEASFRAVFNEFVELKKRCGEATAGLTYPKFSEKLKKNRDDLMAKPGCVGVKFSVYVKDGKAALKATPVKQA
jgi:hypothetical protein